MVRKKTGRTQQFEWGPRLMRLSTKKSLFPVQRMAVIVASRAAAIYIFFPIFFLFGTKILYIFGKKINLFCKNEKKVLSRPFFRHPAAPPETEFFLDWPDELTIC